MQFRRGRFSFPLDAMLDYDPFSFRYADGAMEELRRFGAELIHITGPGDMGTLGLYLSWKLKIPLVISWHTSLHEYAGRRLEHALGFLGPRLSGNLGGFAERRSLDILGWFYRRAKLVLAPNQELVELMRTFTTRPVHLMQRGVETDLFTPARRRRTDDTFRIGYVGRLTPEKNVRFLAEIGTALVSLNRRPFEFRIVGQGSEDAWLRAYVPNPVLTGVLRGEPLAEEYANMDVFVFPSRTDTYGNVVAEALASGVPVVVMPEGGPKFLVESGVSGFIATSDEDFIRRVEGLLLNRDEQLRMGEGARRFGCTLSWDSVFEKVYTAYRECLATLPAIEPTASVNA
jgi:glycosyltransferase involved in cell wall biosynthesis